MCLTYTRGLIRLSNCAVLSRMRINVREAILENLLNRYRVHSYSMAMGTTRPLVHVIRNRYIKPFLTHQIGKKRTAARWPHYMHDRWRHCIPRDHRLSSPASLVMPIGDPRDGFLYPTLTLMMDSYSRLIFLHLKRRSNCWGFNSPIPTIKIEYKNTDINTGYISTHISLEF